MKKVLAAGLLILTLFAVTAPQALAMNTAKHGTITGKTVCYGLASLLIWPGIGQYLNNNETKKNVTHAVLGLTGIFRLWSGWDALIARQGGRWDGTI